MRWPSDAAVGSIARASAEMTWLHFVWWKSAKAFANGSFGHAPTVGSVRPSTSLCACWCCDCGSASSSISFHMQLGASCYLQDVLPATRAAFARPMSMQIVRARGSTRFHSTCSPCTAYGWWSIKLATLTIAACDFLCIPALEYMRILSVCVTRPRVTGCGCGVRASCRPPSFITYAS